jgi:SAM-dependent methyltransferase
MRLIIDREKRLGKKNISPTQIKYLFDLKKEELSRNFIFSLEGLDLKFLDVGARDGKLSYLLGNRGNLNFDEAFYNENRIKFDKKYQYYGLDLEPTEEERVLTGDICSPSFREKWNKYYNYFDVVYCNNVMEHLENPFEAAKNMGFLTKDGGLILIIVPFSQRYHAVPTDYFRYTHEALPKIFSLFGKFDCLISGYDIEGRRNDWQGTGDNNDLCPVDDFGAWRETWFTVSVLKKVNVV